MPDGWGRALFFQEAGSIFIESKPQSLVREGEIRPQGVSLGGAAQGVAAGIEHSVFQEMIDGMHEVLDVKHSFEIGIAVRQQIDVLVHHRHT